MPDSQRPLLPHALNARSWVIYECPNPKCNVLLARPSASSDIDCFHQHALPDDGPARMVATRVVPVAGGSVQPAEPECAACGHSETLHGTEEGCVGLLDDGAQHCWCRGYKNAADVESLIAGCDPEKEDDPSAAIHNLRAEKEALRAALEKLADPRRGFPSLVREIAHAALAGCADTTEPEETPDRQALKDVAAICEAWKAHSSHASAGLYLEQVARRVRGVVGMDPNGETNG